MNIQQPISVPAELRKVDVTKLPPTLRCPTCGDLLRMLHHIIYDGSPVLYCEHCGRDGQRIYYYLVPKGAIV